MDITIFLNIKKAELCSQSCHDFFLNINKTNKNKSLTTFTPQILKTSPNNLVKLLKTMCYMHIT